MDTDTTVKEWPHSPEYQDFAKFLGLSADKDSRGINWQWDDKTNRKIEEVYLYAKNHAKGTTHTDIKVAVKELKDKLGVNWKGKTLIDHLWEYTKFASDRERLDSEMKLLDETPKKEEVVKEVIVPKVEEVKPQIPEEELKKKEELQRLDIEKSIQGAVEAAKAVIARRYERKLAETQKNNELLLAKERERTQQEYQEKMRNIVTGFSSMMGGK